MISKKRCHISRPDPSLRGTTLGYDRVSAPRERPSRRLQALGCDDGSCRQIQALSRADNPTGTAQQRAPPLLPEEGRICCFEITPVSESQKRWETALLDDIPLFVLLIARNGLGVLDVWLNELRRAIRGVFGLGDFDPVAPMAFTPRQRDLLIEAAEAVQCGRIEAAQGALRELLAGRETTS